MSQHWVLARDRVDPALFGQGHVGPYVLGRTVRATDLGAVALALHRGIDHVVEIERFDALRGTELAGPDGLLLQDLAHVVGLRHRYLLPIIGAGIDAGVPYVVRPHRLGRTLDELCMENFVALDLIAAVFHAVAEVVGWLAEQGPHPGACSLGGFNEEDIMLGFDGSVMLMGAGLARVRAGDRDPAEADYEALRALLLEYEMESLLAEDATRTSHRIRRAVREVCSERAARIGAALRAKFEDDIQQERADFGLATLH